jgi:hypothetical protein
MNIPTEKTYNARHDWGMRAPIQKKAAHGFDRSPIAGRLPILFDPALAGFLSKVNALGRAPAI